jgi:D-inositol-3-phosphate glycosyltransferase
MSKTVFAPEKPVAIAGSYSQESAPNQPSLASGVTVSLLTGGTDRPYVFGLVSALIAQGVTLDLIGSDDLNFSEFSNNDRVRFLNLRGDQRSDAHVIAKIRRVLNYYWKLIGYVAKSEPRVFHILWNNKFEHFDRTVLMFYYRLLGKKIALTVHNVNARERDGKDTWMNRLTLRLQYRLSDRIFVHTEKMKHDLVGEFRVAEDRVTVIPFGINNAVPNTRLTETEARQQLGVRAEDRTILFFGNITPYKGLEYLAEAFRRLAQTDERYRLIIAGRPNEPRSYWTAIRESLDRAPLKERVLLRDHFVPDSETEVYFKAADVLVLPYKYIYQSGVLCLGYSFGLPVLAADVGSLKDDIIEGKTGFVFRPEDSVALATAIEDYFKSDLYRHLNSRRHEIHDFALQNHSWEDVGRKTVTAYSALLEI